MAVVRFGFTMEHATCYACYNTIHACTNYEGRGKSQMMRCTPIMTQCKCYWAASSIWGYISTLECLDLCTALDILWLYKHI